MADIIINPGSSLMSFTSSLNYTQTITQDVSGSLILQGSGSTGRTDLFTVNGNNGTLFSVSDDLSDSLFSVNTIAGLPVIEAFANNTVTLGQYGQNVLVVTGSRVGIGTSAPAYKLDITAASTSDGIRLVQGGAARFVIIGDGVAYWGPTANLGVLTWDTGKAIIMGQSGAALSLGSNGSWDRLFINTSGNVGIGTTSISYKLDVAGTLRSTSDTVLANASNSVIKNSNNYLVVEGQNSSAQIGFYRSGTSDITYIGADSSYLFRLWDESFSASYFNILQDGKVGIGTTNPGYNLEVNGWVGASRYYPYNTNSTYIDGDGSGLRITGTGYLYVPASGGSYFEGSVRMRGSISNDNGAYLQINGGTSGYTYFDGTVGIGVTNPSSKLHIVGSGASNVPVFKIVGSGSDTFNWASSSVFANLTGNENVIHLFGKAESGYNSAYVGYRHVSDGSSSNMLTFGLYGSDNLVNILGNGYVGIGTTAPSYTLQVQGTAYINSTLYVNGATTIEDTFTVKTQDGSYTVAAIDYSGAAGGRIKVYTDGVLRTQIGSYSGDETFFNVGYGGNVGIGTSSPSARLDIRSLASSGATNAPTFRAFGLDTDSYFQVNNNSNNSADITLTRSDSATMFNIDGHSGTTYFAGNVGIGTTSPINKLEINAGGSTGYSGNDFVICNANGQSAFYHDSGGYVYWYSNQAITFYPGSSRAVTFLGNGNVGIGSTNPQVKLDVLGTGNFGSPSNTSADYGLGIYSGNSTGGGDYSRIRFYQNSTNIHTIHSFSTNWQGGTIYNASAGALNLDGYNGVTIGGWNSPDAIFVNGGVSYFKGNVGIGTTSPTVISNYRTNTLDAPSGTFTEYRQNGTALFRIGADGSRPFLYGMTNAAMDFFTNTSLRMTIAAGGNVGIGTTNPGGKLTIGTPSGYDGTILRLQATAEPDNYNLYVNETVTSGVVRWVYNMTNGGTTYSNMMIFDRGNVGIGTTNPLAKLSVYETEPTTEASGVSFAAGTNLIALDNEVNFNWLPYTDFSNYYSAITHRFRNRTGTSTWMVVSSSGEVGIGTTTPSTKLHVEGDTYTSTSLTATSGKFTWDGVNTLSAGKVGPGDITGGGKTPRQGITSVIAGDDVSGWNIAAGGSYFNGTVVVGQTAGSALSAGQLVYKTSTNNQWAEADADNITTATSLLGICLNSGTGDLAILLEGFVNTTYHGQSSTSTPGKPLYVSPTAGYVTETAPSSTGQFVRLIGHNWSLQDDTTIYFKPDATWIEL